MKKLKTPAQRPRKAPSNQTGGTAWGKKLAAEFSRIVQSADMKKLILLNFPYIIAFYMVEKAAWLYRHCNGDSVVDRLMVLFMNFGLAYKSVLPSFHPFDLMMGLVGAAALKAVIYFKGRNAKKYRQGEEYGSARWGNAKELNRRYRDTQGPNLLMTRNIRIGVDGYKHKHNTNVLVVGGSGTGKTRTYAVPNVLEAGCSMVITDPKGEILRKTGGFLKRAGYEVRVFDLLNPDASFCYNPFRYVRDDKEVLQLITNLIQNTTPPHAQSSDPFWEKSETALLQALMLYLLHEAPPEEQNFGMVMELLGSAQVKEKDENFESPLDILFERLAMRDPESIAVKQYGIYKQAAGKTAKSILVSVGVRLAAFNLPQIARLTMTDELHLDDLGERRVALFCCIPDSDKSLNYLVGMVYTQLIQTLFYQADRVHRGRLPVPVHCLMDEFPNISLPKDSFQSALATMRSRGIFCSIIVQNIAQLKSMYKDSWESLVGLCDEFLYLGGNEQGTHKYVSELIGKETVETTSRSLSRGRSGSSSTSHQQTARDLMTPDEVRLLSNDKALLFVRGERPVMDWKYNLLRHPNIRFTEDGGAPPYDYTVAPDAHEDLAGNAENYELLDMDDFLPAAEQPKPMFTYPRRNAHASQQD